MQPDTTFTHDLPIVCDPNALTADQQVRWMEIGMQMYKAVQEIQELSDGYALRLPGTSDMLMLVAEDLIMERLCCPFLTFTVELHPHPGPFWLKMTGHEGAKEFLKMAFESANLIDEAVASAAGFNITARVELDSVTTAVEATRMLNERFTSASQAHADQENLNG